MTFRGRLTAAFLAVVLGPVLLGAIFVGVTVSAVGESQAIERLELGSSTVRASLGITCQRLTSAAQAVASLGHTTVTSSQTLVPMGDSSVAQMAIDQRLSVAIIVTSTDGTIQTRIGHVPQYPWVDCSGGEYSMGRSYGSVPRGLSVRLDIRDTKGILVGYVSAIDPIDTSFVRTLARSAGTSVGIFDAGPDLSTEKKSRVSYVTRFARTLESGDIGEMDYGRYVCRLDPEPGQPLAIVLSTERNSTQQLYVLLVVVVMLAGIVAIVAAWTLARSTTRPLTELAAAVDRVAGGDLDARVPINGPDEIGRLAATFNRMTRETQGYVQALTASRDQLRGQLGILGDTLSSTHDLDRILRVILQTASAATGARAGVVLLADPSTGVLIGQCAEGVDERMATANIADLRLRVGEGLLGSVALSGEPRRGRTDSQGHVLVAHEPQCLTYIAVPFTAPTVGPTTGLEPSGDLAGGSGVRGILALYDRHGFDEFDDSDLVMLRTFAEQAAVALDNVRVHEEARRLSLTDALTGLSNYRYLRESLRREVERSSRFGHPLSVLVLDLDHFKEINDTYGHASGDAVLAEFARRMRVEIREVDMAFRHGGEEFVVLLPETDETGATVVAQRLGEAIQRTPVLVVSTQKKQPLRIAVTVSVGVAVYPANGETGMAVLEAADEALYAAKAAGRNTFRIARKTGE